jgi:RNA polymerase sigma factor (sigma-70 family)
MDDKYINRLFAEIRPTAKRAAARLVGEENADEIVQEALSTIWGVVNDHRESFSAVENLKHYLLGATTRSAIEYLRREKKEKKKNFSGLDEFFELERTEDPSFDLTARKETFNSIPIDYQKPLKLYSSGNSVEEIAEDMDISPIAARRRISEGLEYLSRNLESDQDRRVYSEVAESLNTL